MNLFDLIYRFIRLLGQASNPPNKDRVYRLVEKVWIMIPSKVILIKY